MMPDPRLPGSPARRTSLALGFLCFVLPGLSGGVPAWGRPPVEDRETFGRDPRSVYATGPPHLYAHNAGLLSLQLTNLGIIGNPWISEISAGWRNSEYLYQASLWIGAIGEDADPHVSSSLYSRSLEFRPSILAVDTIYESFEGMKGGNRSGSRNADDDGDGLIDEDFQNGRDDDGDGRIDEDFSAIGQQMLSCEYRDDTAEAVTQSSGHMPLGLKVQQRSFQWSSDGINEFVGFDFRVLNAGDQRLNNIYIGFYVDGDVGPKGAPEFWNDDLVGYTRIDTTVTPPGGRTGDCGTQDLVMDIAYIWDAADNEDTGVHGDTPGYFGTLFLGHSVDPTGIRAPERVQLSTVKWTHQTGAYPQGDPRTDFEAYDLLSSREKPRSGEATQPNDYRFTFSAGPFLELEPGGELSFQTAIVVGEGREGMIQNAVNSQLVYNGRYIDADRDPRTGVEGRERCLIVLDPPGVIFWVNPCDSLAPPKEYHYPPNRECIYVDEDCNECTGKNGEETLLHWVGKTAPPPPGTNIDPGERIRQPESSAYAEAPGGDRRIVLQWDNQSELHPDPLTGDDLFEGYRVWRSDNWQRPEGSMGPGPDDWMLVAEFRRHPRRGDVGCPGEALRCVTMADRNEIQEMTPYGPRYPVGRYRWIDTNGILNGKPYFYAITAFGVENRRNPYTGQMEEVEITGRPSAVQKEVIVASWSPGRDCRDIRVVPNPYRGGADWDLHPNDCDPTGTRIAFRNLPEGWRQLHIFSLSGDLVLSAGPGDSRPIGSCQALNAGDPRGTWFWDLITRSGQDVVGGIYLYAVESGPDMCRGRFVIIR